MVTFLIIVLLFYGMAIGYLIIKTKILFETILAQQETLEMLALGKTIKELDDHRPK